MVPAEFVQLLGQESASAILRTSDTALAREAMHAAIRGGFKVIEFTLSIPNALELIAEFAAMPGITVGAGTVLSRDAARGAVEAGAGFLVSPVVDEEVIDEAKRLGVASMPGCATPTEMLRAHRAGADLVKLFPEVATGPAWVQQTRGPMPFLKIVPTSGVTVENAADYLRLGAFAVGFVNSLFVPGDVLNGAFDRIEERARLALAGLRRVSSLV